MTMTQTTPTSAPGGATRVPFWALAGLTLTGSLAMHVFVPAMPAAATALHASDSEMQLTISFYILGMAGGQLLYGPISDRFGRRPVLLVALTVYAIAGLCCFLSPGIGLLIGARLLQAVGGCAGLVLGRAILRDISPPAEIASRLALLIMLMVIGPALAPLAGGLITEHLGWRAIFLFLVAIGIFNIASILLFIPETRPEGAARPQNFFGAIRTLVGIPAFRWLVLGGACATTSMYGTITAAPFIFEKHLHRPAHEVGPWLAAAVLAVAAGTLLVRAASGRMPLPVLLRAANWLTLLSGLAMPVVVLTVPLTAPVFFAPVFLFCLATGVTSPIATGAALSVRPDLAGSASGLYGFTQMIVAALCTVLVGFGSDPALSAGLVTAAVGATAMLAFMRAARFATAA